MDASDESRLHLLSDSTESSISSITSGAFCSQNLLTIPNEASTSPTDCCLQLKPSTKDTYSSK